MTEATPKSLLTPNLDKPEPGKFLKLKYISFLCSAYRDCPTEGTSKYSDQKNMNIRSKRLNKSADRNTNPGGPDGYQDERFLTTSTYFDCRSVTAAQ